MARFKKKAALFLVLMAFLLSPPAVAENDRAGYDLVNSNQPSNTRLAADAAVVAGNAVGASLYQKEFTREMVKSETWNRAYTGHDESVSKLEAELRDLKENQEAKFSNFPDFVRKTMEEHAALSRKIDASDEALHALHDEVMNPPRAKGERVLHPDERISRFIEKYGLPEEKEFMYKKLGSWYLGSPDSTLQSLRTGSIDEFVREFVYRELNVEVAMMRGENTEALLKSPKANALRKDLLEALAKVQLAQERAGVRGKLGTIDLFELERERRERGYLSDRLRDMGHPPSATLEEIYRKRSDIQGKLDKAKAAKEVAGKEFELARNKMWSANRWMKINIILGTMGAAATGSDLNRLIEGPQASGMNVSGSAVAAGKGIPLKRDFGEFGQDQAAHQLENTRNESGL